MIRVLSVIHYPVFGGPHNRNAWVAPFLKHKNVETTVLLPNEPGNGAERLRQAGVDVVTIPLSRIRAKIDPIFHLRLFVNFWGDVWRIRRFIQERNIDIVQINGLVNSQAAIAAKLEGVPVVWQILDTFAPSVLRQLTMPLVRAMAGVVMCTGYRVAKGHPGALRFGERLVLFYPPVDLVRFKNSSARRLRAREKLGLQEGDFVVGNVGNLNFQKGHLTFIRAASLLKAEIPDCRFVILGAMHENQRDYLNRLWREAYNLGLEIGNDLIVHDPGANVAELETAFDVFWMTSEPRSEGIPTAVEEAMALGVPVVATQVGSIAEIVTEGKTGFVVAPYDIEKMVDRTVRIHSDKDLKQKLSQAAQCFARHNFAVEKCAFSHLRAYEMALGKET